uniref:Mitotic checkpoint serine/threonine-protein kinase BUB1 n=1 Tax=Anopheles culicifacies TaxID=139723 RepID=A0A182M815_9DIPT
MNFDEKKENIQPLRGGRNVEQLEYAFVSPEQWEEERKAHEKQIDHYEGDDPLATWYDYFCWMEQTNVSNFKPMIQEQALRRCVQLYENDPRYMQDHRFIKLCIKYIDSQPSPVELYNELYNRGVGTLCAELYIAWAYYYDAVDNFAKTEEVFQKGLRAGAESKADLEQAHKMFGFSMSQRLLHKDECSKLKFQSTLDERRNVLTTLRTSRKKHVGSVRTGLAVKSYQPGIVHQENASRNTGLASNAGSNAIVFTDDPGNAEAGSSIIRPFSSVHNESENIIEAARLANMKTTHKKGNLFGTHQTPSFDIPEDKEEFIPIPVLVDNSSKGVTLSAQFCRRNKPQTPFEVGICVGDPKERAIPMYDKIRLYCRAKEHKGVVAGRTEYSPEELRAYGYFVRRGIENRFTQEHAKVWGRGYDVGIRLHPLHVTASKSDESGKVAFENPTLDSCDRNIQTKITDIYSNPSEEQSIEELLVGRWLKGNIKRCIDRRYQDDIDPVDMDETHVESKRISMGPARFSMAPAAALSNDGNTQLPMRPRKSIFPLQQTGLVAASIQEETEEELQHRSTRANELGPLEHSLQGLTVQSRKRPSNEVLEQEVSKKEDSTPTPLKEAIKNDLQMSSGAGSASVPAKRVDIFVDDSDENDERDERPPNFKHPDPYLNDLAPPQQQQTYYPNDTCSTQMFNLFVKNISTPVAPGRKQSTENPLASTAGLTSKRIVVFTDDDENGTANDQEPAAQLERMEQSKHYSAGNVAAPVSIPGAVINDENAVPLMDHMTPPSTSSGCNSTQSHKQLSTIMERTETSTVSSTTTAGVTKSPTDTQAHSPEAAYDTHIPSVSSTKLAFTEPVEPPKKSVFTLPVEDGKGFCIHIDSTETMANIPLKRVPLPDAPIAQSDDKENMLVTRSAGGPVFQLSEEPTASGFGFMGTGPNRNVSHLVQRELEANSIASFRMATERTNTVPIQLVKPQHMIPEIDAIVPSGSSANSNASTMLTSTSSQPTVVNVEQNAKESRKKNNSLLDLLDTTFSPKVTPNSGRDTETASSKGEKARKECSFDLDDLIKSPQPRNNVDLPKLENRLTALQPTVPQVTCNDLSLLSIPPIKMEKSLNIDVSLALPSFHVTKPAQPAITAGPVERIDLNEFPSPCPPPGTNNERTSFDDINTVAFSLNINHAVNSTIIQDGFKTPSKQTRRVEQPNHSNLQIVDVKGGMVKSEGFLCHRFQQEQSKTLYGYRTILQDAERWDEDEEQLAGQPNNIYQHKPIDMDATMQQINAHMLVEDIDPFEKQLLDAFLDSVDFMAYIAELPTCLMVNKVQPLRKDALVKVKDDDVAFRVQQKIGKGTYGTIFCATNVSTGQKVAMKQERPANLWEYYICLELRSRIESPDILPGFMTIDYAIIGNNASTFVSSYSRYGNILDVCNLVNRVTNRNVDEFIAMIVTTQILSIVDHLHSCQIIHADIKPDNFLFMGPIELGSKLPCIQLIDFGVSIDMKRFPEDVKFKKVITTENFTCIEMLENKPWTYQPDLYGVAATSHVMLFGKYMQVQKNVANWGIKTAMPRYFKKVVWENYFTTLLNIRDCDHLPNLQKLRTAFLEEITLHEKYIQTKISEFNHVLADVTQVSSIMVTFVEGFHTKQDVERMQYIPLGRTGLKVSKVSFGTGTFSQLYGDLDETKAEEAVRFAVKQGINYFDTAPFYGQGRSEEVLGKALRKIPRQAYYIATKVGRYEREYERMFDYSAAKTRESVERSLTLLGVDYIDVVQIHDVEFAPNLDIIVEETLPALEALRSEGKLRFIGVSAYPLEVLKQIISKAAGRFDTVLSYCRNTLFDDSLQDFIPFFQQHQLGIICASGHGMGLLTNSGPQPWHPAGQELKSACLEAADYCKQQDIELGKLAMHHSIELPGPATFLAGMQTVELVNINLDAYFNGLSAKEAEVLAYLKERVFSKIKRSHWEGVELKSYWAAIKALSSSE